MSRTAIVIIVAVVLAAPILALSSRGLKRWVKKCKRRRGGVYLWRTDKPFNRARRHNAYVGESVSFYLRGRQHMGVSRFNPATGQALKSGTMKIPAQPWSDLRPVMHKVIKLPWWLCWKWVLRPLETLVILATWPVYNDAKNHWNPRRIRKGTAMDQHKARDEGGYAYRTRVGLAHLGRRAVQLAGALLILGGTYGWMVTR